MSTVALINPSKMFLKDLQQHADLPLLALKNQIFHHLFLASTR